MRRRRPPFTLVLSALVAVAALAIALAGRGSTDRPGSASQPPTIGFGSTRACVTTSAVAQSDQRSAIVVGATANAPVTVTEQASGPNGTATVARSEVVGARITADEPVAVKHASAARVRACANGSSTTAARTTALRAAYARALTDARALAASQAAHSLTELIRRDYPAVLAQAKSRAAARAHQLAIAAAQRLAGQARAEARQRAGD